MERIIFILPVPTQATWSAFCFLHLARRLHFFLDMCSVSVSVSLIRGTRDLSAAASRRFPMILGDTAGATYARISSLYAVQEVTATRTMRQSWLASVLPAVQTLFYRCGNFLQTTAEQRHTSDTLCPTGVAFRRHVHPPSCRPKMWPLSSGWSCSTGVRTRRRGKVVP